MGKNKRFPVGFPPAIRKIIKEQVGTLGNSEAEVVKNIVLMYLSERNMLKFGRDKDKKRGGKKWTEKQ